MDINPASKYKVRFNDCDLFGHLNNSSYIDYLVNAREDHLKDYYKLDLSEYYKKGLGWVVGSHEIVYVKPAYYNEIITIQSTLMTASSDLLQVETIMMDENCSQLKAIMRTKLIPVNIKTGKKEQHQEEFLQWAKTIENEEVNKIQELQQRIKTVLFELKAKNNA